jgi:hypothetical protein
MFEPWLEELSTKLSAGELTINQVRVAIGLDPVSGLHGCIPILTEEEKDPAAHDGGDFPAQKREYVDVFSEKPFKRIGGGPPPRGKPKPPVAAPAAPAGSTEAIHRAISVAERRRF